MHLDRFRILLPHFSDTSFQVDMFYNEVRHRIFSSFAQAVIFLQLITKSKRYNFICRHGPFIFSAAFYIFVTIGSRTGRQLLSYAQTCAVPLMMEEPRSRQFSDSTVPILFPYILDKSKLQLTTWPILAPSKNAAHPAHVRLCNDICDSRLHIRLCIPTPRLQVHGKTSELHLVSTILLS